MKLKPFARQAAELGIGLTAVTTLILAGCGGGGGGTTTQNPNTPSAAVRITSVTPGKGIMKGAIVVIKDASGNTLGTETTTAAGTAAVSLAATTSGPFVVSVTCPATCTYYDEKSGAMVSGSASAPAMLAVVPGASELNIGVTAATNAAAQYAIAAGTLTPTSVLAANTAVGTLLGLGSADILTPPAIISDAATYTAAQAGTTTADKLANYSAALAMAASGVSAIQAIADYGTAWQQAATTGIVTMPASIDTAALVAAAPAIPTTIANVASQVAAATSAASSAVAAVNDWVAEVSVPGNSSGYWENTYYANAAAMASGVLTTEVHGWTDSVVVSGNTLTFSGSDKKLVGGVWVADTDTEVNYHLGSTGWVLGTNGGTVVNNLDGTITVTPIGMDSSVEAITRTDVSGTFIPCHNATCNGTAKFPAGSIYTSSLETNPADHYKVTSGNVKFPAKVTDLSGVALTALPGAGASFCVQQYGGAAVFTPIASPAQGADNYNEAFALSCSQTDIAAALPQATVTLSLKSTGNAAVPTVGMVTVTAGSSIYYLNNAIIALRGGQVYPGKMVPAGSFGHMDGYNKTALTAYLQANGHPALP